jgi:nucleoside 2-deoxyribosyltransferase
MKEFLVYCAGPISGLTYGESVDWRKQVADAFPSHIKAVSPMRGKDFLAKEQSLVDNYEHPLASQKGITCRDRMDVMRCDLLLVNLLGAPKVSIGTVMEIAWADMLRKPIVLVMDKGNLHDHSMIREVSGFIVPDLEMGIQTAITVLSPTL